MTKTNATRAAFLLCLTVVCTTLPTQSQAAPAPGDRAAILALEQRWIEATGHRDLKTLDRILADDFQDTSYKGQLRTKADHLTAPVISNVTEKLEDVKIRFYGDTAIVTGRNVVTANDHSFTANIRFIDVFVKQNDAWQAVAAQETQESPSPSR